MFKLDDMGIGVGAFTAAAGTEVVKLYSSAAAVRKEHNLFVNIANPPILKRRIYQHSG